jgi:hypothetical protein
MISEGIMNLEVKILEDEIHQNFRLFSEKREEKSTEEKRETEEKKLNQRCSTQKNSTILRKRNVCQ